MDKYTSPRISLFKILRWKLSKLSDRTPRLPGTPMRIVPLNAEPEEGQIVWLGHATLWGKMKEKTFIIDPVLGDIPFFRRHTPLPIERQKIHADVILITHAHYDHFDKPSVIELLSRNPDAVVISPRGFWRYMKGLIPRERCFEMEWWESVMAGGLFITFVPSLHWSNRIQFDINKALWGGYVIQDGTHTIYHSGDTAMGEHFGEIAERFEIDTAFLPIGAYRPEEIMKLVHISPGESFDAAGKLRAKTLIPIHYGTFRLSDEPMDEPRELFSKLAGYETQPSRIIDIGEVLAL